MTPEQQNHIQKIITDFDIAAYHKYLAGQQEHGGDLWKKAVWKQTMPEALDFVIYLATLNQQIETLLHAANKALIALDSTQYQLIARTLREALVPFLNDEVDTPQEPPSED